MNWLDKLEAKYPQLALEGLIRYISFLMLTVFFLNQTNMLPYHMLYLDGQAIMAGQVWRLFTFLLIPASSNFLFLIFELSILVMCADGLEAEWGTFKLTAYYFCGALANIIIAFFVPQIQLGSYFLYLTLFLGYATIYPDHEIYLFLVLPVKIKFLGLFSGLLLLYKFALGPMYMRIAIMLAVGNYILFFGPEILKAMKSNYHAQVRRNEYQKKAMPDDGPRHRCKVCGKTEISDPETQFRYCTCEQCGSEGVAFCIDHLKEHKEQKEQT
jgi:hypothetical protein